jgi:hypothetical protein
MTTRERSEADFPDVITYVVLTLDGRLLFKKTPSRPEFRQDVGGLAVLYHNGPWEASIEAIGGPCRSVDRVPIGHGLLAWVADESLLRPQDYPENVIGGKTVNILRDLELMRYRRAAPERLIPEPDDPWAGPIVLTCMEDRGHDRWCGFIWPLDEEQENLVLEAWRAARGDDMSILHTEDDFDLNDQDE